MWILMERKNGKMIKKFDTYIKELKYSIFDIDDNLLYLPSIVHLDIKKGDEEKKSEFEKFKQTVAKDYQEEMDELREDIIKNRGRPQQQVQQPI